MFEDRIVYHSGEFIPWEQARVHMLSHSFSRGSAIFEVISVHDTEIGPAVFRLDEHIERFFHSAGLLGMDLAHTGEEIKAIICETAAKNSIRQGVIKVLGYYPQFALDILPPAGPPAIAVFALDPATDMPGFEPASPEGTSLCVSSWRKLDPQTVPIEAKAAANYLNGMMARKEAQDRGFDMAVLLDTQGFLAEGGTESIFLVKDQLLLTPAEGTVLQSITRKSILQMCPIVGIATREARIPPGWLQEADEIFLSCTPMKVMAVKVCEGRTLRWCPGPLTREISRGLGLIAAGRDDRFKNWLTPL